MQDLSTSHAADGRTTGFSILPIRFHARTCCTAVETVSVLYLTDYSTSIEASLRLVVLVEEQDQFSNGEVLRRGRKPIIREIRAKLVAQDLTLP